MKRHLLFVLLLALPALALAQTQRLLQAGTPGVTVNANGGFTINAPGSYLLTGDLTVASGTGIVVISSKVTLDLGGYTVASSAAASPDGITPVPHGISLVGPLSDITVTRGHVTSRTTAGTSTFNPAGFVNGIDGPYVSNCLVAEVTVSGMAGSGIVLSYNLASTVRDCSVSICRARGIVANLALRDAAYTCGTYGINAGVASDCFGAAVGAGGYGLVANQALNCRGFSDQNIALQAETAENCTGFSTSGIGLFTLTANNCTGYTTTGTGIVADTATGCTAQATGTGRGLSATIATGCFAESSGGTGMTVNDLAENCRGVSRAGAAGLVCGGSASNCFGSTVSGPYGLYVENTASYCLGNNEAGATAKAIQATNAIGCSVRKGKVIAATKYLGTP